MLFFLATLLIVADAKPLPKTPLSEPRQRLLKGNYAEARAAYESLLKDTKHAPQAAIGIANAWQAEGNSDKAFAALNDAIKTTPNNPDLLAARGDLSFGIGKWDEATTDAAAALKISPDHFAARWVRARILRDSGKLDDADIEMRWFVRTYTAASNADKDITDPDKLLIIGQAGAENARWHNLSKQFSFIINDIYADALKYEPDLWQAENLIGNMLLEKYNRPDAVEAFDKALQLNPNAAEPYVGKGHSALMKYDLKDADAFAAEALQRNAKSIPALLLRAEVDIVSGDFPSAEVRLREAIAINPRDEVALGKLAACLIVLKKQNDAEALAKAVETFDTKPGVFHHEMGAVLESRKQYAKAEACYVKAAALRPKMAEPRTALGLLYLRMGREEEGRKLLDAAFAVDKFNVKVANSRKVMEHLDRYSVINTPHYEVKYDATKDRLLAEFIAESLEEVHANLKKQYGYEPAGKVPFQIFSRHDMFSGRTIGLPDLHTVGASTGRIVAMASPKAFGVAKPFNWGRVVKHELVHIFNLMQTDQQCPHWLTEGLAVRNEGGVRPNTWLKLLRTRLDEETLFNLKTIAMGFAKPKNVSDWTLAYCQANLYVEYLASVGGEDAIAKVLKAYADGLDTEAAIRAASGMAVKEFERGYRKHLVTVLAPYKRKFQGIADETADKSTEDLQETLEKEPNNFSVKARLAERAFQNDQPAEARKLADEVLAKKDSHIVASTVKSRLLFRAGDNAEAVAVLAKALVANPDDPTLLLSIARVYVEAKDIDRAIETLEAGRKAVPLDGDWNEQLAKLYERAEDSEKLIAVLKDVCAQDTDDIMSRLKLAKLLLDKDKAKDGVVYARQAIEIDVTNEEAQKLYVDCLTKSGDTATAEKMTKRFAKD
ncbi:hypothetical protein BH11PLA2_BH11PLA2_08230 [soil metagenome]